MDQHLNEWPAEERRPYRHPYPGHDPHVTQGRRFMALVAVIAGAAGILLAAALVILGVKAW